MKNNSNAVRPEVRDAFSVRRVVCKPVANPKNAAQQQFKDECDMNRIVKNAQRGIAPKFMNRGNPSFGDFSNVPDLTEAFNMIERATSAFNDLPAELRLELRNDPLNITKLTKEQVVKYKLGKALPKGHPLEADSASSAAGQAAPTTSSGASGVAGEGAKTRSKKAGESAE